METTFERIMAVDIAGYYTLFVIPALLVGIGFAIYYGRKPETEYTLKIGNRWLLFIDIIVVIWVVLLVYAHFAI